MNEVASAIEDVRAELAEAANEILPDLCNLIIPGVTIPDGFGGETETNSVIHQNIPCKIQVLGRSDQVIGGAQLTNQTHKITMGANAITKQIKPHYQIVVLAHHDQIEQMFENPIALLGSFDIFMKVAAAVKR